MDILGKVNCPNHSASEWQSWFSSVQKPTPREILLVLKQRPSSKAPTALWELHACSPPLFHQVTPTQPVWCASVQEETHWWRQALQTKHTPSPATHLGVFVLSAEHISTTSCDKNARTGFAFGPPAQLLSSNLQARTTSAHPAKRTSFSWKAALEVHIQPSFHGLFLQHLSLRHRVHLSSEFLCIICFTTTALSTTLHMVMF